MDKLLNIIQKIDAKHLLFTGGMSAFLGFLAVLIPDSGAAIWLFLASIVSATVFVVLIAVKMLHSVISYIFSVIKRTHSVPNHKTKRNTPLIMVGLITLIAITSLRSQIGGGSMVSVIQVCALMIILYGFGMSWTRKRNKTSKKQAKQCLEQLKAFEQVGGLASTEKIVGSSKQWDYPNGWAPLQLIVIEGLRNYGFTEDARRLKEKWLLCNHKVFQETSKLWEKYDVVNCAVGHPGRYPTQPGFGWTNGVFIRLNNHEFHTSQPA